jgi:hypothetical protein
LLTCIALVAHIAGTDMLFLDQIVPSDNDSTFAVENSYEFSIVVDTKNRSYAYGDTEPK